MALYIASSDFIQLAFSVPALFPSVVFTKSNNNMKTLGSDDYQRKTKMWARKWRHLIAVCVVFGTIWEMTRLQLLDISTGVPYRQQGLELETFQGPFTCDKKALPRKVRMIRRVDENYVLLGHGTPDLVTDYNWDGYGNDGWENDLTQQMLLYLKAVKALERSRTTFMDLGANIGTHMLHIAAQGFETHGFEPTYSNYALVHCSLAFSGFGSSVRFNHFGVGDKVEEVCMESVPGNMGDSRVDDTGTRCQKEQRAMIGTLDNYYDRFLRRKRVGVMKIDIQGFEIAALQHGTHLFDSYNAPEVVMFEYEPIRMRAQGYNPPDLIKYFEDRHYSLWHFGTQPYGYLVNGSYAPWSKEHEEIFGTAGGYFDLVAVKNDWKKKAEIAGYRFEGGNIQKY
jgi:FkbM family methyltransferase